MFRIHSAAITVLLALTMTTLAGAQQKAQPDKRQDQHTITADSARLHRDIAMRDSIRAVVAQDHARTQAGQARLDSLKAALASARKATPRDTAAIRRDELALAQSKQALDRDLDRAKHERSLLVSIEKKVTRESDATIDARHDLRSDRADTAHHSQSSVRRDERQDARTIAADSIQLRREMALRDSTRAEVAADHARTQADQARLDSLTVALAAARKAGNTAAVRRDEVALAQAKKAVDQDVDRAEHERGILASIDQKITKKEDATVDAHRDLRTDRSAGEHPSSKTPHK